MPPRWPIFFGLAGLHLALAVIAPAALAPALTGTIYLPLMLLKKIGLPVFASAPSGGWASPSAIGWVLVVLTWLAIWFLVASLLAWLFKPSGRWG